MITLLPSHLSQLLQYVDQLEKAKREYAVVLDSSGMKIELISNSAFSGVLSVKVHIQGIVEAMDLVFRNSMERK